MLSTFCQISCNQLFLWYRFNYVSNKHLSKVITVSWEMLSRSSTRNFSRSPHVPWFSYPSFSTQNISKFLFWWKFWTAGKLGQGMTYTIVALVSPGRFINTANTTCSVSMCSWYKVRRISSGSVCGTYDVSPYLTPLPAKGWTSNTLMLSYQMQTKVSISVFVCQNRTT